jgi:hypothetical protein
MVGDDLPVVAAKRQLCPTISEMTSGKHSNLLSTTHAELPNFCAAAHEAHVAHCG